MNGVVYSTRVEGARPGQDSVVIEVWIEQLRIAINEVNGAASSAAPRTAINHFGTFDIPDSFCALVKDYVARKASFEEGNAKLFAALKARLVQKKSQHTKIM